MKGFMCLLGLKVVELTITYPKWGVVVRFECDELKVIRFECDDLWVEGS